MQYLYKYINYTIVIIEHIQVYMFYEISRSVQTKMHEIILFD
jgi:hypothetical protein